MSQPHPYPRPAAGRPMSAAERLRAGLPPARPTIPFAPPGPAAPGVWLKMEAVADRLRVSKMTAYRLAHAGEFPGTLRIGRSIRVPQSGVEVYLRKAAAEFEVEVVDPSVDD